MSMQDERPDEFEDLLAEEEDATVGEEDLSLDALPTVDDAFSDEAADPAMAPVIEAGGGVAEGFEQSEALLIDHATSGIGGTNRILRDAGEAEREPDSAVYGEADEEHSSEREHD
jgi:hypothetical protein